MYRLWKCGFSSSPSGSGSTSGNNTSGGNTTVDGADDENVDTGWFDSVISWFSNIFDAIGNLSTNIANAISDVFSGLFESIGSILDYINPFSENFILSGVFSFLSDIISYINPFSENFFLNGVLEWCGNFFSDLGEFFIGLFVPEEDYFDNQINDLKAKISEKLPYYDYVQLFGTIEQVTSGEDIKIGLNGYDIGGTTFNDNDFIDFSFITKYRDVWYSWVRGFVFVFLIIYNCNQIIKLLRGYNVADGVTSVTSVSNGGGEKW